MRRMVTAAVSLTAIGAATVLAPAEAVDGTTRTVSASDPSGDVDSRLDIVFESFRGNGDGTATLDIRTAEGWRCNYLQDIGSDAETPAYAGLFWDIDQGADGTVDSNGVFTCDEGKFRFELRRSGHRDRIFPATRPTARSARVTIPLSQLRSNHVSMRAMSRVTGVVGSDVFVDEEDVTPLLRAY